MVLDAGEDQGRALQRAALHCASIPIFYIVSFLYCELIPQYIPVIIKPFL